MKVKVAVGGVNNAVMEKKKFCCLATLCLSKKKLVVCNSVCLCTKNKKNIKNSSFIHSHGLL